MGFFFFLYSVIYFGQFVYRKSLAGVKLIAAPKSLIVIVATYSHFV